MIFNLFLALISFIYLTFLNTILKRLDFCLDKTSTEEKHKELLSLNQKVPLSGSFYFILIIFFLTYEKHISIFIASLVFFCIGLLSDLKITTSPKSRLLIQFSILLLFLFFNKNLQIDTRIEHLNLLMEHEVFRILIISFFLLVLINGFNFIDGTNNLCSLNILIILIFLYFITKDIGFFEFETLINNLSLVLFIFIIFNFFGKNFLGDGGVYGLSFFIGIVAIKITQNSSQVSPYFIANLLWYPAFENLFSILRRILLNKKNYLADNFHLHQLLYKYLDNKKFFNKKYILSSITGILINSYFLIFYLIGFNNYSDTKLQLFLIFTNITIYLFIYYKLKKKFND
ncbi:hypothetical protein ACIJYE_00930 [Candidatus Pelagibacter bacterium nBUS_30]|uniref:hypothetical protein n=1 Tax=Candidatus Pelagibacter bacterium nBUS_30 TaxID=3374191 RepID=UPI003EC018AD